MSISPNLGAFRNYLVKIATNKKYNQIRKWVYRSIKRFPSKFFVNILRKTEASAKKFFFPTTIFEDLGFRYFGPIDGHNIEELIDVLEKIKDLDKPVVLHTITKKGKGLDYAEDDPVKFHGVKEKKDTSKKKSSIPIYQNAFGEIVCDLAENNESIVTITAAMKEGTGLVDFSKKFPNRFFDVGIAEGHAVTFSGGLSVNNKIPIVAIYSTFLQRAFDHIIHDISLQKLPVIFCLDRSGLVGEDGATHHGVLDISYLRCIQNIIVSAPKDGNELRDLIFTATKNKNTPFTIRYPKEECINFDNQDAKIIEIGSWNVEKNGDDVLVLAVGSMVKRASEAANLLVNEGVSCEVVNCRFIKPMDENFLKNAFNKFDRVVTIEEGVVDGGFGEGVIAWAKKFNLKNSIINIGIPGEFIDHGPRNILLKEVGLDSSSLAEKIINFMRKPNE